MENKENKMKSLNNVYNIRDGLYLFCSEIVPEFYGELIMLTEDDGDIGYTCFETVTGECHKLDQSCNRTIDILPEAPPEETDFDDPWVLENFWVLDKKKVYVIPYGEKVLLPISKEEYADDLKTLYEKVKAQARAKLRIQEDK